MVVAIAPHINPIERPEMIVVFSIGLGRAPKLGAGGYGIVSGPRSFTNSARAAVGSVVLSRPMSGGWMDVIPWCVT